MSATALFFSAYLAEDRKALARGLRRRDPDLLDSLIEQYQYRLFRYLLYLTARPETAEDLFQETWIRVLDRGYQYDGQSKFETWLFAIARHLVLDLHRRKTPQSLEALTEGEPGRPLEFAASDPSPLDLFSKQEVEAAVRTSLGQLPAVFREVLLLRFQEDLTLEEIAAVLGAPLSTVKSRLYRGLEALRGLLERRET
jgi:RNA polymerase sigma-70 factor (ECF subfamily)